MTAWGDSWPMLPALAADAGSVRHVGLRLHCGGVVGHALPLRGEGGDHGKRCHAHATTKSIRHCWAQRLVHAHTGLGEGMPNATGPRQA